jgi:hypothetical protein
MAKRKKQRVAAPSKKPEAAAPIPLEEKPRKFGWIPVWAWVLIFLVPLVFSEYMFYMVGRTFNMILFPVVWIAFWAVVMQRSGWPILKNRKPK